MSARILTIASLVLATAVAASTGALVERVGVLLQSESSATLGADLVLRSNDRLVESVRDRAQELNLATSEEVSVPTLAFNGDESALIGLRAVDTHWPLRGTPVTSPERALPRPPSGSVWVAPALLEQLDMRIGSAIEIGAAVFVVDAVAEDVPGRGNAGFSSLAPQVLINREDLVRAELLTDGARSRWYLYLAGDAGAQRKFREWAESEQLRISAPGEVRPEIGTALRRAENLLDLASLCSLVLLAAVIFLLGRYRYPAWAYETAVLRSLGGARSRIWRGLGWPWARDALLAIMAGAVLAGFGQAGLDLWLLRSQGPTLPPGSVQPYCVAGLASLLIAFLQLPALRQAIATPPAHLLRQSFEREVAIVPVVFWSGSLLLGLGWLVSGDLRVLLTSVGVVLGGGLILAILAAGVLSIMPSRGPLSAIGQMQQRRARVSVQVGSLGLGLSILLLLSGLQQQVIAPWQAQLPVDAPNRFVINIQPHQQRAFAEFLAENDIQSPRLMPMVRGRLLALNGKRVRAEDFDDPETRRWINRDFNLSSAAAIPDDNRIIAGAFWSSDSARYEMSADEYAVERLGLEIGSTLTLDVAGAEYQYTVTSLRQVQWDSMQPNFFLLVPPAVLPEAGASWITSYYQTPEQKAMDRSLVQRFPNLTVLNLERLITEIRQITGRALAALQGVFLFTLLSGALLVVGMLLGELPERRRQVAILRALGIRQARLRQLVVAEFAWLGALAGIGAVIIVQLSLAALAMGVFDMRWQPSVLAMAFPPFIAAFATAAVGWTMLRSAVRSPPGELLRAAAGAS